MAFAAATVWQVRTDGNAANGGGFDSSVGSPGTDYSNQAAAQIAYTDMVIDGADSTKFTSAGNAVTSAHVGNVINVTSGAGFTVQRVVIISQAAGVATCDKSLGTVASTGGNGNLGGAVALPSTLLGTTPVAVAGNTVYVRSGTYSLGATTETLGADGSSAGQILVIGYPAAGSPTDADVTEANMPVFTTATNSVACFTLNAASKLRFRNIKVTHTAGTRGNGWVNVTASSTNISWVNCIADGCLNGWHFGTSSATNIYPTLNIGCTARNCTANGFLSGMTASSPVYHWFVNCYAKSNTAAGFAMAASGGTTTLATLINCVANANASGFQWGGTTGGSATHAFHLQNCTFYGNTSYGIRSDITSGYVNGRILNCIIYGNTTNGIYCATASVNADLLQMNNAFGGNGADRNVNTPAGYGDIALTGNPFTSAGTGDFSLDNTASEGAACRSVGYPLKIGCYDDTTATYLDVGAAQAVASAGGGGGPLIGGRLVR